jgi:hypothetical protein
MAGSLGRLLRVRALQEGIARSALEAEAAGLRALEGAAALAAEEARGRRERWFEAVERESGRSLPPPGGEPEREAEESAWGLAVWRRGRAEARQPAQRAEVERARAAFLEGRRERMQAESLAEAARARARLAEARREQRLLDDWHQSRPRRPEPGT